VVVGLRCRAACGAASIQADAHFLISTLKRQLL
jgi:hypothetical protein